jgi:hypothetical protein
VSGAPGVLHGQLESLRQAFPQASLLMREDGTGLVALPHVLLPPGWNQSDTVVWFVVPVGYPMAKPDCFWTDAGLRLSSGGPPRNTAPNPLPGVAEPRLWFSWHVTAWNPAADSLLTFTRTIQTRLADPT